MKVLVIADHDNVTLRGATLSTISAAEQIGGKIDVLVAGSNCEAVACAAARVAGVGQVRLVDAPHYAEFGVENLAALVCHYASPYSHVLAPATSLGKGVMPRVAAALDVAQISEIISVASADTFVRPIYAGNALVTVRSTDSVKVLTVRASAFGAAEDVGGAADIERLKAGPDLRKSRLVSREITKSERPELGASKVVVAGGRGLGNAENYKTLLEPLASRLSAALGASRAAVDAGFVPNDYQVGQTGKIVAPQLYFAIGISGAIQHLAGMKDSKVIVAINKDPEAPIFQVANYGLVGDLFEIVPELTKALA